VFLIFLFLLRPSFLPRHEHADPWCVCPGVHLCELCVMPLQLCCARHWHTRSRLFQSHPFVIEEPQGQLGSFFFNSQEPVASVVKQ
jgi:hypothetical protein